MPAIPSASSTTSDILSGLVGCPKRIDSKWLYDSHGSQLFDRITRLPEYYPTEAERGILRANARLIAEISACDTLVELGSGSSDKTRLLLDAFARQPKFTSFVPVDVSSDFLANAAADLRVEYPGVRIEPQVSDFTRDLDFPDGNRRLVAFLGGTIGNLYPKQRRKFLRDLRQALRPGDFLLLGADLVKDPQRIIDAYSDSAGITANFITNIVSVVSKELDIALNPDDFDYAPMWDIRNERMDLRLRANREIGVPVPGSDRAITFSRGEELIVEISSKFRLSTLRAELTAAGFEVDRIFTDTGEDFSVTLAHVASTASRDSGGSIGVGATSDVA